MRTTKLPLNATASSRPRGSFGYQVICSGLTPEADDPDPHLQYWGVTNSCTTQYGTFRGSDGLFMNAQRMVGTEATHLFILAVEGEEQFNDEGQRAFIGGVSHRLDDGAWISEGRGPNTEPLRLEQRADHFTWDEGDILSVSGPLVGCATQWFVPAPDGGLYFCGHPHRVSGTCLGKPVEGFAFNDQMYLPVGDSYATSSIFQHVHTLFVMWGNEYEDGTIEVGQVGLGADKFAFATFANQDGIFTETTNVTAVFERRDDAYPHHVSFDVDGVKWEWVPGERSDLRQFGPEYRGAEGTMRRVGEKRESVVWMGYVESYKSRG